MSLVATALAAEPVAAQPDEEDRDTDVVFLAGNGIHPAVRDLQWQKDGIAEALLDDAAFPLDGTMAVGVVQWAHDPDEEVDRTRVEVPLTVLDSEETRAGVIDAVHAFEDMTPSWANPGDGLIAGTDHLLDVGREDARWTLCMTTDAFETQRGAPLALGADFAKFDGVAQYSVIALQPPEPHTYHREYGPHVFGGGSVMVAEPPGGAAQVAEFIVDSCLDVGIQLAGLEVNQSTQSWENTIQLVEDKKTVVRAFAQVSEGGEPQEVTGWLHGSRDGVDLPHSPLLAINNPEGSLMLDEDITSRRATLGDSFNFRLPWDWPSGTLTLRFEATDADDEDVTVTCLDAALPVPNDCAATVDFKEMHRPEIKFVGVSYEHGGSVVQPAAAHLWEQGFRVESLFPVPEVDIFTGQLETGLPAPPTGATLAERAARRQFLQAVNAALQNMRADEGCVTAQGCTTLYYGVLLGDRGGGRADGIPGDVSSGWNTGRDNRSDAGFFRNVGGHEIGHSLGLYHAVDNDEGVIGGRKRGHCRERASEAAPGHPRFGDITGVVGGQQRTRKAPLLGPAGDVDTEVWGLDTRFVHDDVNRLAVVDPGETGALLGYCWAGSPQDLWTSDFEWDLLIDALEARFGPASAPDTTTGRHLLVSGSIEVEEDPEIASFDPVLIVDGEFAVPEAGDYRVVVHDDAGGILRDVAFEPVEQHARPEGPDEEEPPHLGVFTLPVLVPEDDYRTIQIVKDNEVLGEITASDNAPEVEITTPEPGSTQDGADVTFAWAASDVDGDELVFAVRYSPDLGETWRTLGMGLADEELTVPRSQLPGSTNPDALFEVTASDGVLATRVTSDPFTVADNAPTIVTITSPLDGQAFSGSQLLALDVVAHDPEDGRLKDEAIEWTSGVDGPLGTGDRLDLPAGDLVPGVHELTVSATDSAGNTAEDHVSVTILSDLSNRPPALKADQDLVRVDEGSQATNTGTVTDPDDDPVTLDSSVGDVVEDSAGAWTWTYTPGDGPADSQTVTVTGSDPSGAAGAVTFELVVDNVPPTVDVATVEPDEGAVEGAETDFSVSAGFSDPGTDDAPFTCSVDWGDGSGNTATVEGMTCVFEGSHTYAAAGTYPVTVTVVDKDDGAGTSPATPVTVDPESAPDPDPEAGPEPGSEPDDRPLVERVAGETRVHTAVAVSQRRFPDPNALEAYGLAAARPDTVVLARSGDYADALAGGPLAAHLRAPLLLTQSGNLHSATAEEITRLDVTRAILLGGVAALTRQVERDVEALGVAVDRLAGENRFHTAAVVAERLPGSSRAWLAEGSHPDPGRGWPDALTAGAAAAREDEPILLTLAERLPEATLAAFAARDVAHVTLVGGVVAVSPSVQAALEDRSITVRRLAGDNRYDTALAVTETLLSAGADPAHTWLATGTNWPDALAGGPAAAQDGLLLLVDGRDLDRTPALADWLTSQRDDLISVILLGGHAAIHETTEQQVRATVDGQGE